MAKVNEEDVEGRTTKDRYHLLAKVTKRRFAFRDHQSRGKESNEQAEAVVLVPEQTTECDCFFAAWLPPKLSAEEQALTRSQNPHSEIVFETGNPINGYFRGALFRASDLCDRPHIFVMTKRAEDLLASLEGKKIQLVSLGAGEEEAVYELKLETKSPYTDIA